ncbi:hypothetical protein CesoFtcFv8_017248 [Champsocephalus esox]|uniref:Uncharacterized protein n=1 Tax=Champsocephalus esox TaxID=159716 RepID=A0AAN8GQJ8_9TELE|nr:hypothetical protein CesoFtcFv8_017248 [Champsocephalus esox]
MSRSWKIAVSQQHEHGAGGSGPGDAALQEKRAFFELPCCPHAPATAPSRPNREGADRGSAPPPHLSCPQKTGQDNR